MNRLIPYTIFCLTFSFQTIAQHPCNTATISACVDLKTELHIQQRKLRWVHNGVAPGSDPNCSGKTKVNEKDWANWETPFVLGFNTSSCKVDVSILETNEISKLIQAPSEKNNWETIWFFGDPESPGAHRYTISLSFCPLKEQNQIPSKTQTLTKSTHKDTSKIKKQEEIIPIKEPEHEKTFYSISFDSKSSALTKSASEELNIIIKSLTKSSTPIEINGYPKNGAENSSQFKLYEERSVSIFNYLIKNGISQKRINYITFGDTKPPTANNFGEKIEIKILGK